MSDTNNWSSYVFPTIFVAIAVVIKDVLVDGYAFDNQVLIVDIGLNTAGYLLSDVIVHFGFDKMFATASTAGGENILSSGADLVVQPALQGLMVGSIRPFIHSTATLITHPITFMSSFVDAATYNIVGKYLSSPLVYYFEEK